MDAKWIAAIVGSIAGTVGLLWRFVAIGKEMGKHLEILDRLTDDLKAIQVKVAEMDSKCRSSRDDIKKSVELSTNRRIDDLLADLKPQVKVLVEAYANLNEKMHQMEVRIIEKISDLKGGNNHA